MNALAIDYMELTESLSKLSPDELRGLKNYVFATYPRLAPKDEHSHSLAGIWQGQGFDKIDSLHQAVHEARQEINEAVLQRKF